MERRPPSYTSLKVKDLALSTHRATDTHTFCMDPARHGLAQKKLTCWVHAPQCGACTQHVGVVWAGPWSSARLQKAMHAVSTNHRQQQVERIGCSARARDGWRRGWHGGARLSARLPMEQAMEARTCTGRCGLGAPSEKLFSLSSVFGAATSKTRPPSPLNAPRERTRE